MPRLRMNHALSFEMLRPFILIGLLMMVSGCDSPAPEVDTQAKKPRAENQQKRSSAARTRRDAVRPVKMLSPEQMREKLGKNLAAGWWHQEKKVALLSVTGEQQDRIDSIMLAYLVAEFDNSDYRHTTNAFSDALKMGDFEKARGAAVDLAATVAAAGRRQLEAMIEVIRVLEPEQRSIFVERFPGLLQRPWIQVQAVLKSAVVQQEIQEGLRASAPEAPAPEAQSN